MPTLAEQLLHTLNVRYNKSPDWIEFSEKLGSGEDLEAALTNIEVSEHLRNDIISETWKFISTHDLNLLQQIVEGGPSLPL